MLIKSTPGGQEKNFSFIDQKIFTFHDRKFLRNNISKFVPFSFTVKVKLGFQACKQSSC